MTRCSTRPGVVAKGFSQVADIDYHETFSPTARMTSIRMLLQLAVAESLKVHQLDFDSAYLNAEIDCEIYMEPPELFPCNRPSEVLKIKKSLYGLKQSGRLWNEMLHAYLVEKNFTRSLVDTCVYTQFNEEPVKPS
ncbi:unnamed protein product, partial [Meganyctiphanes norvegica]